MPFTQDDLTGLRERVLAICHDVVQMEDGLELLVNDLRRVKDSRPLFTPADPQQTAEAETEFACAQAVLELQKKLVNL